MPVDKITSSYINSQQSQKRNAETERGRGIINITYQRHFDEVRSPNLSSIITSGKSIQTEEATYIEKQLKGKA